MLTLILILRWLAFTTACYNISWSVRCVPALARGRWTPPNIVLGMIFLFMASIVAFWSGWMTNPGRALEMDTAATEWRLLAYLLLAMSAVLAAIAYRVGTLIKAHKFYSLYDHLEAALAIGELASIDPVSAAKIVNECRVLTAAAF